MDSHTRALNRAGKSQGNISSGSAVDPRSRLRVAASGDTSAKGVISRSWAVLISATMGILVAQNNLNLGALFTLAVLPAVLRWVAVSHLKWPRYLFGLYGVGAMLLPLITTISLLTDSQRSFRIRAFGGDLIQYGSLGLVVVGIIWACCTIPPQLVMALFAAGIALRYTIFPDPGLDGLSDLLKFRLGPTLPFILLALLWRAPKLVQAGALLLTAIAAGVINLRAGVTSAGMAAGALACSVFFAWLSGRRGRPSPMVVFLSVLVTAAITVASFVGFPRLAAAGVFGTAIQQRQLSQIIHEVGLLGARIEPGATLELFKHNPWGLGPGVWPSLVDQGVAWDGIVALGIDPALFTFNAEYLRVIVSERIFLHSNLAEAWWHYGLPGAILVLSIAVLVGREFVLQVSRASPWNSGLVLYACARSGWDCFFEPTVPIGTNLFVTVGFLLALSMTRAEKERPLGQSAIAGVFIADASSRRIRPRRALRVARHSQRSGGATTRCAQTEGEFFRLPATSTKAKPVREPLSNRPRRQL